MKAACIQMNSTADRGANLATAAGLLAEAAGLGAGMAFLPEHFSFLLAEGEMPPAPESLTGPTVAFLKERARELGIWISGGSFCEKSATKGKFYNTCPLITPGASWPHFTAKFIFLN